MKWFVVFCLIALSAPGAYFLSQQFLESGQSAAVAPSAALSATSSVSTGGIRGVLYFHCAADAASSTCGETSATVQVFSGDTLIQTLIAAPDGAFNTSLPAGDYRLMVPEATSTRCTSIGLHVRENEILSANIRCDTFFGTSSVERTVDNLVPIR